MRKADLHSSLQATAVAIPGRSGCFAVIPPSVSPLVEAKESNALLYVAHEVLTDLNARLRTYPSADLLLRCLNRREAVDSSQIEGTRTGFDDLLLYEMAISEGTVGEGTDAGNDDASETLAYVRAFTHGADQVAASGKAALDEDLIRTLHRTLLAGRVRYTPGEYRDRQNYIGNSLETASYVPPPPGDVPRLMADLVGLLQYEPDDVAVPSVLMRAAIAHVQFEAIHPFLDGNGRTGRMLMPFMLMAEGEPPLHLASFLKLRQRAYYDALWQVQVRLNWAPWLKLFLECVIASGRHTLALIDQLDSTQTRWNGMLRAAGKRRHATIWKVVERLAATPVISAKEASRLAGVSFPAANDAIAELVALDILRPGGEQQRNRYFQAHEVLNAMYAGMDEVLQRVEAIQGF